MKHKIGETVRIRSKEWIDAQGKSSRGDIDTFVKSMFKYAGRIACITDFSHGGYRLDVDNSEWIWRDFMFDPDYKPDENPLSSKDAIIAMVRDGELLYDEDGKKYYFNRFSNRVLCAEIGKLAGEPTNVFTGLHRRPKKRKRSMTRWETLDWANSEESRGWFVKIRSSEMWRVPQFYEYDDDMSIFRRARLLPDLSGIDESTEQGFYVEE
jgi:hypothetical protein